GTLTTSSVGGTTLGLANAVTGFNASNITSGAITLVNTGAPLNITGISQAGTGDVSVTNTGSITTSGGIGADGNVMIYATGGASDDVTISNTIALTGLAGKALDIRANRNIEFNTSADVTTTAANSVTLNSDRDGANGGAIRLLTGTSIASSGGDIVLGGGATPATLNASGAGALTHGIALAGASLSSGAGNITLHGAGAAVDQARGVLLDGSTGLTSIASTGGAISITGLGGSDAGGAGAGQVGVQIGYGNAANASVTNTGAGTITISGTGGAGSGIVNSGVYLETTATAVGAVDGAITITGVGGAGGGLNSTGVTLTDGAGVISTGAGAISITGTGATGESGILAGGGVGVQNIGGATATGDILLRSLAGTGISLESGIVGAVVQTAGQVTLNAVGGGAITQAAGTGGRIQAANLLVLGDTSATASLASATNDVAILAGNLTGATATLSYTDVSGFGIGSVTSDHTGDGVAEAAVNGLTVGSSAVPANTITLTAGGAVTQTQAVTTGGLQLLGAGSFNLSGLTNNV
ncbi:MAG: hypothetical protein Q8M66_08695, partial [Actinomycetota bacterium]|nr:hypothetical protein [Actinomycetota bacterium]